MPPLLFALLAPVVGRLRSWMAFAAALLGVAISAAMAAAGLVVVLEEGAIQYALAGWAPPLGIEYVLDRVSAFVALVMGSVALLTLIATRRWAQREAGDRSGPFYGLVLLLVTGLLGIVLTGDLFNLFVFMEISSLASYALIFLGGRRGMLAGFRYLMLGTVGATFYLLGVGFMYFSTGTLNMADMLGILQGMPVTSATQAGAVFIFTGLALKMGLVPLHLWLPDAYTYAPSAVNTVMAPIATKAAAYAMLRMFLDVFPEGFLSSAVPVAQMLLVMGLVGSIFGGAAAIAQKDLRRMLAYSSISQLGLIAVGLGLATPLGFAAALLHIMNHAVMKAALFVSAASIRLRTGSMDIGNMAGIGRRMPVTMAAFALAAIAIVGVPPMAGFFSKWYLAQAGVEAGQWAVVAVVLGSSLLTAIYSFRVLEQAYLRPGEPEPEPLPQGHAMGHKVPGGAGHPPGEAREAPMDVVVPAAVLGVGAVVVGIGNAVIVSRVLLPGVS